MAAVVTGISPKEGKPGTKLTIRGENFGNCEDDLVGVFVCGKNCLYTTEWISSSKITCRVGMDCSGRGDIIVMTKKGGRGTCNIQFTAQKPAAVGPLEVSNVWVEEASNVAFIRNERAAPRAVQQDPLGIKGRQSVDKPTVAEHRALFPGQSPDPSHERFSPIWFLLHHHKSTSFSDLKRGLNNMKNITTPSAQPTMNTHSSSMQHIKDSLPVFFEVHEALNSIHGQMGKKSSERDKGMTYQLEKLLEKAENDASVLFKDVLTHKAKADKIRNALAVIQRFKLLFYLPGRVNLARNESPTENFSQLVADVDKVRRSFKDTQIPVFQQVMNELETLIKLLQSSLHAQLISEGVTIKEQQNIVRKLIELGASGDPTWDALKAAFKTLRERNTNYLLQAQHKIKNNSEMPIGDKREVAIEYIEKVLNYLRSFLPDMWRLWILYSTGTLIHNDPSQASKIKQQASQHTKEIKRLFSDELLFATNMIRALVLSDTLKVDDATKAAERKEYGIWDNDIQSTINAASLAKVLRLARELEQVAISTDKVYGTEYVSDLSFDLRVKTVRNKA